MTTNEHTDTPTDADRIADWLDTRAWQTEFMAPHHKRKAEREAAMTSAKTYREAADSVRRGAWNRTST